MITIGEQKIDEIHVGENAIRTAYVGETECWSAARPITERSVGDVLRYGNNTYVILDFNHTYYPENTVQILTLQTVNVTYTYGYLLYKDPTLLTLFSPKLQNALVATNFKYGWEWNWKMSGEPGEYEMHLDEDAGKVNVPSLYEIGAEYTPRSATMKDRYIDGVAFDYFVGDKNNLAIGTKWALRSYDLTVCTQAADYGEFSQWDHYVLQVSPTGFVRSGAVSNRVLTSKVSGDIGTTAAARVIASLPITTQVSAKPDENGIYDIKLP